MQASLDSNFATGIVAEDFKSGPGVPGSPGISFVTPGNDQLTVNWFPPDSDGGSAVTHYVVRWKGPGQDFDSSRQATPTLRTYIITGLTNGDEYSVRVAAVNNVGQGAWSS